jgi:spermidine/putrescine transport system ATP-binding protein
MQHPPYVPVLSNITFTIEEGRFVTLLGPSGCGKTTILRMIAGFEDATTGAILVQDARVEDKEAYERDVNTVFQSYALFPHMTVYDNIAYGLTVKRTPKAEIRGRVGEMLDLVRLRGFEDRKPDRMSGGQKQRVAIARALINRPKVLLLDEPLGALDLKLRKQMQIELKRLQKRLDITFVYVTHDQEEALTMSDRIAVINSGALEQIGAPAEIYKRPLTRFVADFIGESNIFSGCVRARDGEVCTVDVDGARCLLRAPAASVGGAVAFCVRPEAMKYSKGPKPGFTLSGVVKNVIFVGAQYKALIVVKNKYEVKVSQTKEDASLREGDPVSLYWEIADAVEIDD